jgi:hypothetical protein
MEIFAHILSKILEIFSRDNSIFKQSSNDVQMIIYEDTFHFDTCGYTLEKFDIRGIAFSHLVLVYHCNII